ncbi:hypothetical protein [Prochlorococcus sp. MIT 1341]|uniref:hypothetical protein n=1 Tax=Prochlorococcus sp. MIT 1341 TaxID=3096221 RepID=UPI002A7612D2|nr:hypothetical protein [Prochlorococcus sp. MIT 1341]
MLALTINYFHKRGKFLISFVLSFGLSSCTSSLEGSISDGFIQSKQEPALSGNGEKLAFIIDKLGRPTIQLRDIKSGQIHSLRHFSRNQPHSSPSLSWSGRYLAVIIQRGNRRLVTIEDRLTGKLYSFPLIGERTPIRVNLSPDASTLAIQLAHQGKWKVEVFDLRHFLSPDISNNRSLSNSNTK